MNTFPPSVLVVDDNKTNRELLSKILEAEECTVRHATSGEACLAELRDYRPELLLLDVVLPDANGVDLCARIKSEPSNAELLVILISGNLVSQEEQTIGLEIGADDYITRPFDKRELLARIQAIYRLRESIRARAPKSRDSFSQQQQTNEAARIYEQGSLRESNPEQFDRACTRYRGLIEAAIKRRIHKNVPAAGEEVRSFAMELQFAQAAARDIIEIHAHILAELASSGSAKRALLLQEESRLLLVEVMGHVLNLYRLRS